MNKNENKYNASGFQAHSPAIVLALSFTVFTAGLFMILFSVFAYGRSYDEGIKESEIQSTVTEDKPQDVASVTELSISYILKENDEGKISVYFQSGEIYRTFDIPVYTLPMSDQKRLKVGIYVFGEEELASCVEGLLG